MANSDDIRYVVVFDADGNVRASTFPEGLPVGLREAEDLAPDQRQSLLRISTSEGEVLDAAYPIGPGRRCGALPHKKTGRKSLVTKCTCRYGGYEEDGAT